MCAVANDSFYETLVQSRQSLLEEIPPERRSFFTQKRHHPTIEKISNLLDREVKSSGADWRESQDAVNFRADSNIIAMNDHYYSQHIKQQESSNAVNANKTTWPKKMSSVASLASNTLGKLNSWYQRLRHR